MIEILGAIALTWLVVEHLIALAVYKVLRKRMRSMGTPLMGPMTGFDVMQMGGFDPSLFPAPPDEEK